MNKAEIIKAVAQSTGHTQKAVGEALAKNIVKIKASKELADAANGASSEGK